MAISSLSPVTALLLADTKEFTAKMDEAGRKMEELGKTSTSAGEKFTKFGKVASDAVLGLGAAAVGFAVDEGLKLNETMDKLQNSTGLSDAAIKALTQSIIGISNKTGASTADLATSLASVEQAGIKGGKALQLVDAAAKAALATNTNVTQVTQSLIAVQALHLKGMQNVVNTTGLLVAGSHNFVGGLSAEADLLHGKVGAAFSEYGFSLKQAIEYGSIFSKVGLPTRSIATLATGLGKILGPIQTVTDSGGKLTKGISSTYLKIEQLGLNFTKVAGDVRTGNLSGLLLYLKDVAQQTNQPLSVLLNTVLGSGGSISGSLLLKNLGAIKTVTDNIKGAGAGSLNAAFTTASHQFGNQLHLIENNLVNSAAEFGLKLIPYLSDAATFVENALQSLETHPAEQKALTIDLGVTFAAAVGLKIAQALQSTAQTGLLTEIAANTAATAAEGGVGAGAGVAGDAALAGGGLRAFGKYVGVFGAGVVAFEAASKFLSTKEGEKVGNYIIDNNVLGLGTLTNTIADLTGKRVHPKGEFGKGEEKYLKSIGEWGNYLKMMEADMSANYKEVAILSRKITKRENRGKVTIKHTASVKIH